MSFKKLYSYIAKNFLKHFAFVTGGLLMLISILNLFDILDKTKSSPDISWWQVIEMAALQVPTFLEDISIFLILLSSMITLFILSSKSEITIFRASGISLWHILMPIIMPAFLIGVIFITLFNPLSIASSKRFKHLEQIYILKEINDALSPANGIWLKQPNINKKGEEIIIRASKIYKKNIELADVNLWFFDKKGQFYQKIDAKNMFLRSGYWKLENTVLNNENNINERLEHIEIVTNLEPKFIVQKIINNFENVKLFSLFELPKLISDLESSGFSSRKFQVYFYSLLNKPLLFISMVMISAFFSIGHIRSRTNIVSLVICIMIGLLLYIGLSIINAFGAAGMIPPFTSTWIITMVIFAVTILITFKKEHI